MQDIILSNSSPILLLFKEHNKLNKALPSASRLTSEPGDVSNI